MKIEKPLIEGYEKGFNELTIALNSKIKTYSWDLKLSDFPAFAVMEEISTHDVFKHVFEELNTIKNNPCLYQFDLIRTTNKEQLIDELTLLRKELKTKEVKMAPVNKVANLDTLYVGIRQPGFVAKKGLSMISSRILAHFGYYPKGAGLQLRHWPQKDLEFRLSVSVLDKSCAPFLELIEKVYSMQSKPIIGSH
jgi:hypothetical protein